MEYLEILGQEIYKITFLLIPILISVALIVWVDRRVWGLVQKRKGPNVVGPFGLLQTLADALKYIFKEIIIPASANKTVFILAPIVTIGANIKIVLLELAGMIISLKIYFKASATVCNKPNGPTTFGPRLFCTKPQTLLSNHTIKATETKTGINTKRIL